MKRILTLGLALLMLALAGCSAEVTDYRQQQPAGHFPLLSGQNGSLGDGSGSQRQTAAPLPCRH
jgi:hypothetical protein